jgi:hypothetical protein
LLGTFGMRLIHPSPILEKAALEVGLICLEWSMLEDIIGSFMAHLLGVNAEGESAAILDGNMDIRSKIHATKGLAFLRHYDEEWLRTTLTLLDHVDNNLRGRRNAIIHANWFTPRHNSLLQRNRRTKIVRPQSFQLALEVEQNTPVKIRDLCLLRHDIQQTWAGFLPLFWYMCDGEELIDPTSSPTISWRRYLRLAGLGNPLRNVNAVRLRQRRASRAPV